MTQSSLPAEKDATRPIHEFYFDISLKPYHHAIIEVKLFVYANITPIFVKK
jgi:hypothetical protein